MNTPLSSSVLLLNFVFVLIFSVSSSGVSASTSPGESSSITSSTIRSAGGGGGSIWKLDNEPTTFLEGGGGSSSARTIGTEGGGGGTQQQKQQQQQHQPYYYQTTTTSPHRTKQDSFFVLSSSLTSSSSSSSSTSSVLSSSNNSTESWATIFGNKTNEVDKCDARKCLSPSTSSSSPTDCWAIVNETYIEPFTCSDDYVGRAVLYLDTNMNQLYYTQRNNVKYLYYTCCPKNAAVTPPTCSYEACTTASGKECSSKRMRESVSCSGVNGYKYLRRINLQSDHKGRYVCCTVSDGSAEFYQNHVIPDAFRILFSFIAFICSLTLILAILLPSSSSATNAGSSNNTQRGGNNEIRDQPYNMYLVGLAIPDFLFNVSLFVVAWLDILGQNDNARGRHIVQYLLFAFNMHANIWLNLIITYQIFKLLLNTHRARRIKSPTIKRVKIHIAATYTLATILAIITAFEKLDYTSEYCDLYITLMTVCICLLYLLYVCIRIYYQKLLPLDICETRTIAIYFFRIIASFLVFWLPIVILEIAISCKKVCEDWWFIVSYLGSFQAITTVVVAMYKPDVYDAVTNKIILRWFWWCPCCCCFTTAATTPSDAIMDSETELTIQTAKETEKKEPSRMSVPKWNRAS